LVLEINSGECLTRLLDIEAGQVFLDGHYPAAIADLRSAIAYVPKTVSYLALLSKNNIRYGDPLNS